MAEPVGGQQDSGEVAAGSRLDGDRDVLIAARRLERRRCDREPRAARATQSRQSAGHPAQPDSGHHVLEGVADGGPPQS
jgi:hypothetical protein